MKDTICIIFLEWFVSARVLHRQIFYSFFRRAEVSALKNLNRLNFEHWQSPVHEDTSIVSNQDEIVIIWLLEENHLFISMFLKRGTSNKSRFQYLGM